MGVIRRLLRTFKIPLKFGGLLGQYMGPTKKSERLEIGWPEALREGESAADWECSSPLEFRELRMDQGFPMDWVQPREKNHCGVNAN